MQGAAEIRSMVAALEVRKDRLGAIVDSCRNATRGNTVQGNGATENDV